MNAPQHMRPKPNYRMAIDMPRLRKYLFGSDKIPPLEDRVIPCVPVYRTRWSDGGLIGFLDVKVVPSSTIGSHHKPGQWKGTGKHRLHVKCDTCDKWVPAGRLAQHCGYSHKRPT